MKRKNICKRVSSLFFIFLLLFTNLGLLSINEAQAAVTLLPPTAGSCQQNSGTGSANNYVYPIGTIQITANNNELDPGQDDSATTQATTGNARATNNGRISQNGDVIGNVFSIVAPTGTKFVILSGKEDSSNPSNLAQANATITNSSSQQGSGVDSSLGISVGVTTTTGNFENNRVIVAIARDADTTGAIEYYPKSGTGSNIAVITITGLGLSIPPSGDTSLSGTLQATLDSVPPSGIGISGDVNNTVIRSVIPGFSGTLNICTIPSTQQTLCTPNPNISSPAITVISSLTSCTRYTANDITGSTRTVYPLGTIKITSSASSISPGLDDEATGSATTGNARATRNGSISNDGDIIGNIFSLIPPTGTKFVLVPNFEKSTDTSQISQSNISIGNTFTDDSKTLVVSNLGISVGVINQGTGAGRAIVAIARDADSTGTSAGAENFPKSATGTCTATISINGLALVSTSDTPLSGVLQATVDANPLSGIGMPGGASSFIGSAFPGIGGTTIDFCTVQTTSLSSTSSSSSGSIASSSGSLTSSSGGFTTSSSGGRPVSSSGGSSTSSSGGKVSSSNDCSPCLVSGSRCPTNCPEKLINCDGVAYLNICDYQRIKCGCITTTTSTGSSGGIVSTSSSTSSGGTVEVPKLNSAFEGIWKGIVKQTSTGLGRRLITLGLCINDDDGELEGTVAVKKFIDLGEIISQEVKSENEVLVDVIDSKDNLFTLILKLIGTRKMQIKIGDKTDGTARQTTKNKRCFIPSSSRAQKQKLKSK